jgi:chromosome partitioning protein
VKIFATYNLKGGVGKTATAVNLAYLSARDGHRTLLWDLDPQGAATFYFRVEPKVKGGGRKLLAGQRELEDVVRGSDYPNLDVLPADFSYRHMDRDLDETKKPSRRLAGLLQPLAEAYDHVFLDCAPSISRVSEAVFVAADALLVPTIPTVLSLRTLAQLRKHLGKRGPKRLEVLPFFALVDRRKGLHRQIVARAEHGTLRTTIPYSTWVERMGLERRPLPVFAPHTEASRAYEDLWREILSR